MADKVRNGGRQGSPTSIENVSAAEFRVMLAGRGGPASKITPDASDRTLRRQAKTMGDALETFASQYHESTWVVLGLGLQHLRGKGGT